MEKKMVVCAADYQIGESEPVHAELKSSQSKKLMLIISPNLHLVLNAKE